ncbi:MAG: WYL domain-containing protein [Muribaculaceae bacterium]|nr:WYL domain-containing protein [Muribaculaceae bacterium]
MSRNLFARYLWEINTLYDRGHVTLKELNQLYRDSFLYDEADEEARLERRTTGNDDDGAIPRRTWDNHRREIETIFDVNIECRKSDNTYYIADDEGYMASEMTHMICNHFAVKNMLVEADHLKSRVMYENIPSGYKHLTTVIQAMREGKALNIVYQSFARDEKTEFVLHPYCLKVFRQRWYVVGWHEPSDDVRIYGLDRVDSMTITTKKFTMPANFDPQEYFEDSFGVFRNDGVAVETVRLRANDEERAYLRSLPLHHSQQEVEIGEDYSVFEWRLRPSFDFKQAILAMGANVEVLEPQWLREDLRQKLTEMLNLYTP